MAETIEQSTLPEGFVLNTVQEKPKQEPSGLPEGFVLDTGEVQKLVTPPLTTRQMFPNVNQTILSNTLDPLIEFERGFARGGASLFGKLDVITDMVAKMTRTTKGGFFEDMEQSLNRRAQELPETGIDPVSRTIAQIAGGAIPIISEFAAVKLPTSFTKGFSGLSDLGKFGILGGLEGYRQDRTALGATEGVLTGLAAGMTLQSIGPAFKQLYYGGKKSAKMFVEFVTGDKRLAQKFVDNPSQFNINPLGKTKTHAEIIEENNIARDSMKTKFADEKLVKSQQITRDQQLLSDKLRDTERTLSEVNRDIKANMQIEKAQTLAEASQASGKAIEAQNNAMKDKAVGIYDNTLEKFIMRRKQAGEAVGNAVDATVNRNPTASVPFKIVNERVSATVKKLSPFGKKEIKEQVKTGTSVITGRPTTKEVVRTELAGRTPISPDPTKISEFKAITQDIKSKKAEGGFNVKYLQDMKKALNNLSSKYFRDDPQLGILYKQMSKDMNPATIVSDNPSLSSSLREIAQANKEFSSLVPKYEEAMKHYFRKDAQGNFIPDINKAISAIGRGDKTIIRQMKKADSALPVEDRIFPQMEELLNSAARSQEKQKAIVSLLKRKSKIEQKALDKATRESLARLKKKNQFMTREDKETATKEITNFNTAKNNEYTEINKKLTDVEEFYRRQDLLRGLKASGKAAVTLQGILAFTAFGPAFRGTSAVAPGSLAGALALSPIGAATLTKGPLKAAKGIDAILQPLLRQRDLQRVAGSEILKHAVRNSEQ